MMTATGCLRFAIGSPSVAFADTGKTLETLSILESPVELPIQ
jgi:hypothetical protein